MKEESYLILTRQEQHDMLANTLLAQERDHYVHSINQERYELILSDPDFDRTSDFGKRICHLLDETQIRKKEVEHIMRALKQQLPSDYEMSSALTRLSAKKA